MVQFSQCKTVIIILLIKAYSINASASMIPENEAHSFRWIITYPPGQKISQCRSSPHIGFRLFINQRQISILQQITLYPVFINILIPEVRSAGLVNHLYLPASPCCKGFLNITAGGSTVRFQITSTKVYKDCPVPITHRNFFISAPAADLHLPVFLRNDRSL